MDFHGSSTVILTAFICILISYVLWKTMYRKRGLPPGPTPLPLIGNLLQVRKGDMAKTLMEFGQEYGPVYTFYFGPNPVVVFWGYDAVKEALVDHGEDFIGRGKQPTVDRVFQGYGLITSEGDRWRQLRRFSLSTLRNFGLGKRSIEERIQEECQFLIEELKTYKEKPFDPAIIISKAVSNVISSVVFGQRFEYDDTRFHRMLDIFYETFELMSSTWGQEKDNPNSEFTWRNLVLSLNNLFFAGGETVATTLKHGFLLLLKYPDIQAKVCKEIDSVIGQNRVPNIEDRNKMPYTEAVIHEIQRFSNVIPMNAPHSATKDTVFRGYTIPKGTDVCALLTSVLGDPTHFATPHKFNPSHFLDKDGCFKRNEAFMPFSIGKRACIGEGLARTELFLFLTNILQNFILTSQTEFTEADIAPRNTGFANVPISYQMSFVSHKL
ncbi:cytochrome P450 2G1 isoform X2 [Bombina bombina]|uniref:cytochrome P450 2G1 isoform X2 n=1 Tax=Bombina bombina TaxID=8345 RepID=UPI00235A4A46|nr:cytochrome P450 2G1 isoform X2 [Bombina bombina]